MLFSGGLDSILAAKVLQLQGIDVVCIRFVTPFFGYSLLENKDQEKKRVLEVFGVSLEILDISEKYLTLLKAPPHGYGKYLNPCLDCKILMIKEAIGLLEPFKACFIATGEVIGQRPMSQRRDAMRLIELESGAEGILLRPLCALHLPPTRLEQEGIVDRRGLLGLSGRGRKEQIRLAQKFGIKDYPAPAGGCLLTDPILSQRFKTILERYEAADVNMFLLACTGRHFPLDDGSWLVVGRNQDENQRIEGLAKKGDIIIQAKNVPGPTALWRFARDQKRREHVLDIFSRYVKKRNKELEICLEDVEGK